MNGMDLSSLPMAAAPSTEVVTLNGNVWVHGFLLAAVSPLLKQLFSLDSQLIVPDVQRQDIENLQELITTGTIKVNGKGREAISNLLFNFGAVSIIIEEKEIFETECGRSYSARKHRNQHYTRGCDICCPGVNMSLYPRRVQLTGQPEGVRFAGDPGDGFGDPCGDDGGGPAGGNGVGPVGGNGGGFGGGGPIGAPVGGLRGAVSRHYPLIKQS